MKNLTIVLLITFSGYANAGLLWDYAKSRSGRYCNPTSVGCVAGKQAKPVKQKEDTKQKEATK